MLIPKSFLLLGFRFVMVFVCCMTVTEGFVRSTRSGVRRLRAIVVAEPSSSLQIGLIALSTIPTLSLIFKSSPSPSSSIPKILFSTLFAFLASYVHDRSETVVYQFTDAAFEIARRDGEPMNLNPLFQLPYSYSYTKMGSYSFLPSPQFPVFLYLTEGDTPPNLRIPSPILCVDSVQSREGKEQEQEQEQEQEGQVHLFPLIASPSSIRQNFNQHNVREMQQPHVSLQTDFAKLVQGLQLL